MIKIRITGLPGEIERFLAEFKEHFFVLHESKPCKNSNSRFVRKYIDVQKDDKEHN